MTMGTPRFWQKKGVLARLLLPLAGLYQIGYLLRRALTKPYQAKIPIICVGNVVAGGAGKTPIALEIGRMLKEAGVKACFLSKAYGGSQKEATLFDMAHHTVKETGDEPRLLAGVLPVVLSKDRKEGVKFAEMQGFSCIVMDDGLQNPHIKPDCAFVVIDAGYGFGNGYSLPAGPLRESPKRALSRADAVILTQRSDAISDLSFEIPTHLAVLQTTTSAPIKNKKLVAFCAIARPEPFFAALRAQGATLFATRAFPDHHLYSERDARKLIALAHRHDAMLITTAKDATRLPNTIKSQVLVADLAVLWHDRAALQNQLVKVMDR